MLTVVEPDADALWTKDEQEHALREAEASCFLLRPSPRRFVLFPIQHRQIWEHYKTLEHSFWTAEDLDVDGASFARLPDAARARVCALLDAHLCAAQQLRIAGLVDAFAGELQAAEARCYFGFQGMLENIHIEALSSTLMRLEPLCLHAPARRTVDAVHPMLEACTSPQYSFMRRLLVYAATLDFLRAASASACRLMELEFPSLATLFSRMARDIARCCEFAKLLCRMVVPSRILESKWLLHLSHNTVAACAIALPNLSRPHEGYYRLAEAFSVSLGYTISSASMRSPDPTTALSPSAKPQKHVESAFSFVTDEEF